MKKVLVHYGTEIKEEIVETLPATLKVAVIKPMNFNEIYNSGKLPDRMIQTDFIEYELSGMADGIPIFRLKEK